MTNITEQLLAAEKKAQKIFAEVCERNLIVAGKDEETLNKEVFQVAKELFEIDKYWHKRIVRAGKNTLCLYHDNPENLTLGEDDIVYLDFGPLFEDIEADFGRTYVLGNDPEKIKLQSDLETIWKICRDYYFTNPNITGAEYYAFICTETEKRGWKYICPYAGHLVGIFPHEHIEGEEAENYIRAENTTPMSVLGKKGTKRHWILEIYIRHPQYDFGGFFEQLLI